MGHEDQLRLSGLAACAFVHQVFSPGQVELFFFNNKLILRLFVGHYLHKGNTNLSLRKNVSAVIYEHM